MTLGPHLLLLLLLVGLGLRRLGGLLPCFYCGSIGRLGRGARQRLGLVFEGLFGLVRGVRCFRSGVALGLCFRVGFRGVRFGIIVGDALEERGLAGLARDVNGFLGGIARLHLGRRRRRRAARGHGRDGRRRGLVVRGHAVLRSVLGRHLRRFVGLGDLGREGRLELINRRRRRRLGRGPAVRGVVS